METKTWYELSKINWGLIMNGKKTKEMYLSKYFHPPYDEMHEFIKDKGDWCKEDLYGARFAPSDLDAAISEVSRLNGSSESVDWVSLLRESYEIFDISDELEKVGKNGKRGKLPDLMPIITKMRGFVRGERAGLRDVRDIDWQSTKGLQPSGWKAVDIFGGMATSGLIVVGAPTKTGKSFFVTKFAERFLNHYEEKKIAVFPLELGDERFWSRGFQMYPNLLKPYEDGRIFTDAKSRTVNTIYTEVEALDSCGLVIIDGLRQLVRGSLDTAKFAEVWSDLGDMGVLLNMPILITVQPNRVGKNEAITKFLNEYSIEWSGDAENYCEQLWMLQYVAHEKDFEDYRYPLFDNAFYLQTLLQREGWKHPAQQGPGAVIFKDHVYDKDGNLRLWEGEPHANRLFSPGSRIGTKRKSDRKMRIEEDD